MDLLLSEEGRVWVEGIGLDYKHAGLGVLSGPTSRGMSRQGTEPGVQETAWSSAESWCWKP